MDLYSRFVAVFKVLLPLTALAILATLFLLSRGTELDGTIPFAENEIADRLRDQQITAPFFSGTTPQGDEIMVTAALARPGGQTGPAQATDVSARLTRAQGGQMTLDANTASADMVNDMAMFSGDVVITTSTGLVINTDVLNTALQGISGNTPGTVTGTGPFGDFAAGQMTFGSQIQDGPLHVLFKGGVKLVYDPQKME